MLVLSLVTVNLSARDGLLALCSRGGLPSARRCWRCSAPAWRRRRGVLVSLRAPTVRQAAQTLNIGILLLIFIPVLGLQALPDSWKAQAGAWAMTIGVDGLLLVSVALLALLDLALLAAAFARFRRLQAGARLIGGGAPGPSCFWR